MTDHPRSEIIHREFDVDADNPAVQIAEAVADIEGKDSSELATMYGCVDGMLDELFSMPPSPQAQMKVEFSYESYRITVEQNGQAEFIRTA